MCFVKISVEKFYYMLKSSMSNITNQNIPQTDSTLTTTQSTKIQQKDDI